MHIQRLVVYCDNLGKNTKFARQQCFNILASRILRLALFKESNRVGVSLPSPEYYNRSSFRNIVFSSYLEFWTMDSVQKSSVTEYWPVFGWISLHMKQMCLGFASVCLRLNLRMLEVVFPRIAIQE
jgi:hypothetical protein